MPRTRSKLFNKPPNRELCTISSSHYHHVNSKILDAHRLTFFKAMPAIIISIKLPRVPFRRPPKHWLVPKAICSVPKLSKVARGIIDKAEKMNVRVALWLVYYDIKAAGIKNSKIFRGEYFSVAFTDARYVGAEFAAYEVTAAFIRI